MFFKKSNEIINKKVIAEEYLRNLNDLIFEKTIEIVRVYREADKKVAEIEENFDKKIEEDFEQSFESMAFEETK